MIQVGSLRTGVTYDAWFDLGWYRIVEPDGKRGQVLSARVAVCRRGRQNSLTHLLTHTLKRGQVRLRYTLTSTSERARALGYLTHLQTSTFVIPLNSARAHGLAVFACRGKRNTDEFDWDVWENRLAELTKMLEQVCRLYR